MFCAPASAHSVDECFDFNLKEETGTEVAEGLRKVWVVHVADCDERVSSAGA